MPFQTMGPESPFARYSGVVPENFLRILAFKESGFRPEVVHPKSHATGLFQITSTALNTFNQRNNTKVGLAQLVDPDLNTRVASQHLAGVINVYKKYRSLQPDWTSRRWLELLTLGWNAGHNAIANIAGRMEAAGIPNERINIDTIRQTAESVGGSSKYVADPARVSWSKSVAAMFLGGPTPRGFARTVVESAESTVGMTILAITGLTLLVLEIVRRRRKTA
jgi:hypothetical protein